jgi:hypothetical protein
MSADPIRAEISGSDRCCALGVTVCASSPVLALCRKLVAAGYDPGRPLHAYRGDMLCLTVTSIGWGAKHVAEDNRLGTPVLRRYRPPLDGRYGRRLGVGPASPFAPNDREAA